MIRHALTALAALGFGATASAQEMRPVLTHETASAILHGCQQYAVENDVALTIAVYDQGVDIVALLRMDGAAMVSLEIAQWKGESAARFNQPTGVLEAFAAARPSLGRAPGVATLQGGLPIVTPEGAHIGGVGVSGAPSEVDEACAAAGIEAAGMTTTRTPAEEEAE